MIYALLTLCLWLELVGYPAAIAGAVWDGQWRAAAVILLVWPLVVWMTWIMREAEYERWLRGPRSGGDANGDAGVRNP